MKKLLLAMKNTIDHSDATGFTLWLMIIFIALAPVITLQGFVDPSLDMVVGRWSCTITMMGFPIMEAVDAIKAEYKKL